jgi:hypothetical protein
MGSSIRPPAHLTGGRGVPSINDQRRLWNLDIPEYSEVFHTVTVNRTVAARAP